MDRATGLPSGRVDRARSLGRWASTAALGLLGGISPAVAQDTPRAKVAVAPAESNNGVKVLDTTAAGRAPVAPSVGLAVEADPIARARRVIADCKAKYDSVQDYTCTFFKQERVDGKLYTPHVMTMKARTQAV